MGEMITAHQKALLNKYVTLTGNVVRLVFFKDIIVLHGGTLVIAPDTHAVYARKIRLHEGSRVVCHGNLSFLCRAMIGDYSSIAKDDRSPNLIARGGEGAVGIAGETGPKGHDGTRGRDAQWNLNGGAVCADGGDGGKGTQGSPGGPGGDGATGSDVLIQVSDFIVGLDIDARGGVGGRGGDGGAGGAGGDGGNGGSGGISRVGGIGGNGSDGGPGADGGPGGNGGRGATVVIAAQRITTGTLNVNAAGGEGGTGGTAGRGGPAGVPGEGRKIAASGSAGASGQRGTDGRTGRDGSVLVVEPRRTRGAPPPAEKTRSANAEPSNLQASSDAAAAEPRSSAEEGRTLMSEALRPAAV